MGEKALVESQVADAIELIKRLDAGGTAPTFAAWYYYDDADEWRLLLASPSLDALLQKHEALAYRKVIDELVSLSPAALTVSDLKLVGSESALPRALRLLIRTEPQATARVHCTDNLLNGIFIKEVIILRSASSHREDA